jgi:hypothetical protein
MDAGLKHCWCLHFLFGVEAAALYYPEIGSWFIGCFLLGAPTGTNATESAATADCRSV